MTQTLVATLMSEETSSATVRVDAKLLEMARIVCAHTKRGGRQLKLSEYLDGMLRPLIEKDHAEVLKRVAAEAKDPGASKPKKKE